MRMRIISAVLAIGGALAALTGGAGLLLKAEPVVDVSAEMSTEALLIPPQMVAFAGDSEVVVTGAGMLDIVTGRPGEIEAYARYRDASQLVGIESWEDLVVTRMWQHVDDSEPITQDIFRDQFSEFREYRLDPAFFPVGESALIIARPGEPLQTVEIELRRNVGYGWAWPALSAGAFALLVGLVMATIWWLDLRPVGAWFEERFARLRKRPAKKATAKKGAASGDKMEPKASPAKPAKKPRARAAKPTKGTAAQSSAKKESE